MTSAAPAQKVAPPAPKRRTPNAVPPVIVPPKPVPTIVARTPVIIPRPTPVTTAAVEDERKKEKERAKRQEKQSDAEPTLKAVGSSLSSTKDIWSSFKNDRKKEKKRL